MRAGCQQAVKLAVEAQVVMCAALLVWQIIQASICLQACMPVRHYSLSGTLLDGRHFTSAAWLLGHVGVSALHGLCVQKCTPLVPHWIAEQRRLRKLSYHFEQALVLRVFGCSAG
jgi:hypothetical protein